MFDLSVVILSYNTKELTCKCLKSIFGKKWNIKYEVWVVDNASSDGSVEAIKRSFPQVHLVESQTNLGFAGGNNLALKKIESKYILLLNSDTEILSGSLEKLVQFAEDKNYDIVSCKLQNSDGSFQPNAGELPIFIPVMLWISGLDDILKKILPVSSYQATDKSYYYDGRKVGWISGSVMLVKNEVFKKIGYLDEKIFMYGEDVEFCLRAKKAGFSVGWTDRAEIIHLGGGSSKRPKFNQWTGEFKGLLYIYKKYYGFLPALFLRFLFYIFIVVRILGFFVLGRKEYAKTYAKVFISI
ncbi:MAG: glycosyltransferase family 2 protein [Patescibacteria group bacterium]|nr:glycosyltransferase family 2 protein [Patescibacteria group bacterium]